MVIYISWRDDFKFGFDCVYKTVKRKYADIRFPCYGGRYYCFFKRRFEELYFYLTKNSILYTASGAYITEIPFDKIKKISIRQGLLFRFLFQIRIVADRKYHLQINNLKGFSTALTGNGADNVKNFIDTLRASATAGKKSEP